MRSPVRLVRNTEANRLFDSFLLSSIVTVLATRLYLHLTGYPQIGGDSVLHIAHMLPGGILMVVAILIMVGSINRSSRDIAAFIGGIGFGLFWDELGKFITKDNDYFFQPTIGLIYLSFIGLYLLTRYVIRRAYHPEDYLANALDLGMEGVIGELDPREYKRAKYLLSKADPNHSLYSAVANLLDHAKPTKAYQPFIVDRLLEILHKPFRILVGKKWLQPALIMTFTTLGLGLLGGLVALAFDTTNEPLLQIINDPLDATNITLLSAVFAGIFIWIGIWNIREGRTLEALRKFETALLVLVFVTQVFLFLSYQLSAVIGLAIVLPILFVVRMLISETHS